MSSLQRLILENEDGTTYQVLFTTDEPIQPSVTTPQDDDESYGVGDTPRGGTIPPETRIKLKVVHDTIRGYTEYAIGAFKNLAIAEVEELNLKFNLKISTEGGLPVLASAKAETDFSIEVKCKFPKNAPT